MSTSAYTDITPSTGLLQGNKKTLRLTLLDASGTGVSGESANISLYIVEPSGSVTISSGFTDNGDGTYDYEHTFDESGWNKGDWTHSTSGVIQGWSLYVSERTTSSCAVMIAT